MDELTTFLTKIALIFAAGLVPLILGDKIAGAVSGKISDWTRGMKKHRLATSRGGAALASRRKFKESEAWNKALGRTAKGNVLSNYLRGTKLGKWGEKKGLLFSDQQRARMRNLAFRDYAKQSEGMSKITGAAALRPFAKLTGIVTDDKGKKHELWELDPNKQAAFLNNVEAQAILHTVLMKPDLANDNNEPEYKYIDNMQGLEIGTVNGHFIPVAKELGAAGFWDPYAVKSGYADRSMAVGATAFRISPKAASKQSSTVYDKLTDNYRAHKREANTVVVANADTGKMTTLGKCADKMVKSFIEQNSPGKIDIEFQSAGEDINYAKLLRIYRPFFKNDNSINLDNDLARGIYEHKDDYGNRKGKEVLERLQYYYKQMKEKGTAARPTFTREKDLNQPLGGPGPGSGGARTGPGE